MPRSHVCSSFMHTSHRSSSTRSVIPSSLPSFQTRHNTEHEQCRKHIFSNMATLDFPGGKVNMSRSISNTWSTCNPLSALTWFLQGDHCIDTTHIPTHQAPAHPDNNSQHTRGRNEPQVCVRRTPKLQCHRACLVTLTPVHVACPDRLVGASHPSLLWRCVPQLQWDWGSTASWRRHRPRGGTTNTPLPPGCTCQPPIHTHTHIPGQESEPPHIRVSTRCAYRSGKENRRRSEREGGAVES